MLFVPGVSNTTSFEELENLASDLVNQVQTGGLEESLNISIRSFAMSEPVPDPVDPTGGVRATNETGKIWLEYLRYSEDWCMYLLNHFYVEREIFTYTQKILI
jgi:hypothetical protein